VLASGGLYTVLPDALTVGPRWLFPSLVLAFLIPTVFTHRRGQHRLNALLGVVITGVLTTGLLLALLLLIAALLAHKEPPTAMLVSAVALWTTNILVFALWYWRLDAGGPHSRERRAGHPDGAFLFPQMTMETSALREAGQSQWLPNFVDYLFLALRPVPPYRRLDTPVLARWAKLFMMLRLTLLADPRPVSGTCRQYPLSNAMHV
jgi:hypothetical protein